MNKSISKKKIIKYVYKINKSINCSNDKLNSYLKHLNYHGKQNYNMIGGDFVEDKITELNNILNELSKRPPLDIDSAVNAKILKTDADITTYNKNVENKLVAILISMGMTDGTARKTLGI